MAPDVMTLIDIDSLLSDERMFVLTRGPSAVSRGIAGSAVSPVRRLRPVPGPSRSLTTRMKGGLVCGEVSAIGGEPGEGLSDGELVDLAGALVGEH